MRLIGILIGQAEDDPEWRRTFPAFVARLQDEGWVVGENCRFEKRHVIAAGGPEVFDTAATDLVAAAPDVILAFPGPTAGVSLVRKTRTIPIVFVGSLDPVLEGLVASISHPGGNATGFTLPEPSRAGKLPQLLKQIAPNVTRVMHLIGPGWTSTESLARLHAQYLDFIEEGARASGISVSEIVVTNGEELERALATFSQEPNGGLVITPDAFVIVHRSQLLAFAARFRLPAVYNSRLFSADGGLLSYGGDQREYLRGAGDYVARILDGVKPADLPVQTPKKFELVVNLRTAGALGLNVPPSLLAQADELIK